MAGLDTMEIDAIYSQGIKKTSGRKWNQVENAKRCSRQKDGMNPVESGEKDNGVNEEKNDENK